MKEYPHHYAADATAKPTGSVTLSAQGLPALRTAPPALFDGPGDLWSPETLFVAAAGDCFVLTFHAIARASNLSWTELRCHAEGTLDRIGGITRFTELKLHAVLVVPPGTSTVKARHLLQKSERACLVTNSLAFMPALTCEIRSERPYEPVVRITNDDEQLEGAS